MKSIKVGFFSIGKELLIKLVNTFPELELEIREHINENKIFEDLVDFNLEKYITLHFEKIEGTKILFDEKNSPSFDLFFSYDESLNSNASIEEILGHFSYGSYGFGENSIYLYNANQNQEPITKEDLAFIEVHYSYSDYNCQSLKEVTLELV